MQPDKRTNDRMELETERLRKEIEEVRAELSDLRSLRGLSYVLIVLALLIASTAGFVLVRQLFATPPPAPLAAPANYAPTALAGTGRIEMGTVPVEINGQPFVTGVVEFARPFSRKPLVFICEAGHAGLFLACKTDAISETQFTWAIGAGGARKPYQSELAWIAVEPK